MAVRTQTLETAPPLVPPVGTLLDVADVREGLDSWAADEGLYPDTGCVGFGHTAQDPCTQPNDPKDTEAPHSWVDGTRFSAYVALNCRPVGWDWGTVEDDVRSAFTAGEARSVESSVMEHHFGTSGATDLNPAGALPLVDAVALLEGHLGYNYAGQGVIHAPRAAGYLLTQRAGVTLDGRTLRTSLGTPVVAGGGYYTSVSPAGAASAAGEAWLYATGPVVIRRSGLEVRKALGDPGGTATANEVLVLGERSYRVSTGCYIAAVRAQAAFS